VLLHTRSSTPETVRRPQGPADADPAPPRWLSCPLLSGRIHSLHRWMRMLMLASGVALIARPIVRVLQLAPSTHSCYLKLWTHLRGRTLMLHCGFLTLLLQVPWTTAPSAARRLRRLCRMTFARTATAHATSVSDFFL
jgi:hypothetical protein